MAGAPQEIRKEGRRRITVVQGDSGGGSVPGGMSGAGGKGAQPKGAR